MTSTLRYYVKITAHRTDPNVDVVRVTVVAHGHLKGGPRVRNTYRTTRTADGTPDTEVARSVVTELFDVDGYTLSTMRGAHRNAGLILVTARVA